MHANEIICASNDVIINDYLIEVHPDLSLVLDVNGVLIMDNLKMLEFIPYFNILNVVNMSKDNENIFYITYQNY